MAVKQIVFEEKTKTARIELDPRFEKNGDGSTLHLTAELAVDLKQWIEDEKLEGDNLLFSVPQQIVKTFHRDCIVAGVDRKDARGKQIDIHALRYTFCTLLSQIGVAPRLAQSAMRHKDINLTMTLYTDARNLDVAKAVGTLPSMFCPMAENTVQLSDASKAMVGGLSSMEMMLVKLFRMADAEKQEAIISSLV